MCVSTVRVSTSVDISQTSCSSRSRGWTLPSRVISVRSSLNSSGVSATSAPSTQTRCASASTRIGPTAATARSAGRPAARRRIARALSTTSRGLKGLVT